MSDRDRVIALTESWLRDPCYDLEEAEGFEQYKELLANYAARVQRATRLEEEIANAKQRRLQAEVEAQRQRELEELLTTVLREVPEAADLIRDYQFQDERASECACYHTCADDPQTACSLSGTFHVHADEPCSVHPDAPGDW